MAETTTAHPVEIEDSLVNPDCGWGIWLGPISPVGPQRYSVGDMTTGFEDDAPLFSYACIDWYWRFLEPEEGRFTWEDLDKVVNYWTARGKQINMRLWTTFDLGWEGKGGSQVAPDWLFDKAGCRYFTVKIPLGGEPVGTIRAPDYVAAVYLSKVRAFMTAARDRYEPHSNDSFTTWHVGAYGPWGEWHSHIGGGEEYKWPSDEVEHETLVSLQNIYKDLFGTKCQMCCVGDAVGDPPSRGPAGTSYENYKYRMGIEEAAANGWALGLHGGGWGLEPDAAETRHGGRVLLREYWPSNVHYGEANWAYADLVHGRGCTLDRCLDGSLRAHFNWLHQYMTAEDYRRYPNTAYFERGLRAGGLGYRFVLTEVEHPLRLAAGSTFVLKQTWVNRNAGRGWRRYPLAVYLTEPSSGAVVVGPLVDDQFDQTMWIAGETYHVSSQFALPSGAPSGTYDLRMAMVDRFCVPRIRLAIENGDAELRYIIGSVRIVK